MTSSANGSQGRTRAGRRRPASDERPGPRLVKKLTTMQVNHLSPCPGRGRDRT